MEIIIIYGFKNFYKANESMKRNWSKNQILYQQWMKITLIKDR